MTTHTKKASQVEPGDLYQIRPDTFVAVADVERQGQKVILHFPNGQWRIYYAHNEVAVLAGGNGGG